MNTWQRVEVDESSRVGEARRAVVALGKARGGREAFVGRAALVVTEMATNLIKHATGGFLLLRSLPYREGASIEIVGLDRGPGISNMRESLRDGYSTVGSPGTGLGAIRRMSSRFEVYTLPNRGTAMAVRIYENPRPPSPPPRLDAADIVVPLKGEPASGDACAFIQQADRFRGMVVDGLGHGLPAAEASRRATELFYLRDPWEPEQLIVRIHNALRGTRGAALAVADVNHREGVLRYAGVGNISGRIVHGDSSVSMVSHYGTAGHELRKIQTFTYSWPDGSCLVMHSDGLSAQWNLDDYPGLRTKSSLLIAAVLFRDFSRGNDDAAVMVASEAQATP